MLEAIIVTALPVARSRSRCGGRSAVAVCCISSDSSSRRDQTVYCLARMNPLCFSSDREEEMSASSKFRSREGVLRLRAFKAARLVLAVGLCSWFGLFPIIQAAHLVFADHAHRLCDEHHRFEDVPRISDLDLYELFSIAESVRPMPSSQRGTQPEIACPILNCSTIRGPALASSGIAPRLTTEICRSTLETRSAGLIALQPPLIAAPKTSPPVAAA